MNFEQLTSVIYVTPEHDEIYTYIKEVDEQQSLYTLDFDDVVVPENKIRLNTHASFSVPSSITNDHILKYHYDRLIDRIVSFLRDHNSYDKLKIYREKDTIYFETIIESTEDLEDKEYLKELIDKLNRLIGMANSTVKSRFNRHIITVLKYPLKTHHLHTIRV